jgi:DNA-binding NtrC family response regulator
MPTAVYPPRTILLVDDEPAVRRALARVLEQAGYQIISTDNGQRALELLRDKPIDLILSDHHMPELSGIDLLKLVRVRHPHVVRIILTGDKDPDTAVRSINESEVYRFIRKPWNDSDLRTIMHFAFETIRLQREKRRLLAMVQDERAERLLNSAPGDPVGLERELLLLAEDELHGA